MSVNGYILEKISTPVGSSNKWPLQFITGTVGSVVTSGQDLHAGKAGRNINSVLARPNIGKKSNKPMGRLDETDRYFPMLRGMVDVPIKGDSVLLCKLGGIQYYFGPLNILGTPNNNLDPLFTLDSVGEHYEGNINEDTLRGKDSNYPYLSVKRLIKDPRIDLDDPWKRRSWIALKGGDDGLTSMYGDYSLEGRFGNSLRLGSRDEYPYLFLSNGRAITSNVESYMDGSIFSMTTYGSLSQTIFFSTLPSDEDVESESYPLPINTSKRKIGNLEVGGYDYDYGNIKIKDAENQGKGPWEEQIFMSSDRITLCSKEDSIFISSRKDIWLGTTDSIRFKTQNMVEIDSNNIYIGGSLEYKEGVWKRKEGSADVNGSSSLLVQPLVLGDELKKVLNKFIDVLNHVQVIGIPMSGISGKAHPDFIMKVGELKTEVEKITSNFHYVENNSREE